MVNRIFPSRSGPAESTPTADKSASTAPAVQSAAATPAAARSVSARVLGGLSFLLTKKPPSDAPARFAYSAASLMPSKKTQTPVPEDQPASKESFGSAQDKLLETSIRAALPGLERSEASRVQRLLDKTLRAADPARQTMLLKLLAASVQTAEARQDAPPQTSVWQSLTRTSVNDHFQGSVASLSREKEAQLLQLQRDIQKLAPELAIGYQSLLRVILANRQATQRDDLLNRLARQVAARTGIEPET